MLLEIIFLTPAQHGIIYLLHGGKGVLGVVKEYIAGEPQRYEIGNRVFIVEPRYDKNGKSMSDILLKLIMANIEEKMRNKVHRE